MPAAILTFARKTMIASSCAPAASPAHDSLDARDVSALLELARGGTLEQISGRCLACLTTGFDAGASGFYLLAPDAHPIACETDGVPIDFLDEYEAAIRERDPVLHVVLRSRHAMTGGALPAAVWGHSPASQHLQRWGFGPNLQGPLEAGGRIVGTLNLARRAGGEPFNARDIARFAWICRAVSVAVSQPGALYAGACSPCVTAPCDPCDPLPPRAAAVGRLVRDGTPNKAIARTLGISEHTVKEHVRALCVRFGAPNRTALSAMLALRSTPSSGGIETACARR